MCGRFTLTVDPSEFMDEFPWINIPQDSLEPRYNIAPTQPVAVLPNDGKQTLDYFIWGLIPSWADDPKIGNRMINARAETLAEKPSFRAAYRRRRCLVFADGFYEWKQQEGDDYKTPFFIHRKEMRPFAFAGLWEIWHASDGSEIRSCTIITTEPNKFVSRLHNRMPVILTEDGYQDWLAPDEVAPEKLQDLLRPYPGDDLQAYPVTRAVNDPGNDRPELIQQVNK